MTAQPLPNLLPFHKRMSDGAFFPIRQVIKIVRAAYANPSAWFGQSLSSHWHGDAKDVIHDWQKYCQNEINRRGGLLLREANPERVEKTKRARAICHCRWCGSKLDTYKLHHDRFCDSGCKKSFCA